MAEEGEIVVLEPRRLAARMAARRVADELGEKVGGVVGYQVRFEDVSSARTRIRFVTEGVLGRRLIASPELAGVAVVVLDEFHERHLQGDVALALVERLRRTRRPDLRVVAMSATLATEPLAAYLGAPVLRSEGRRFDVAIEHLPAPDDRPLASQVASAVRRLVLEGLDGDVLVFLPGAAEIRRAREACEKLAAEADLLLVPLHGDLSPEEQDAAVRPGASAQGDPLDERRRVVGHHRGRRRGRRRGPRARRVAGAVVGAPAPARREDQPRVGHAAGGSRGRTRPGRCLRLYTRADFESRPEHDAPEIRRLDLAQTWLELAALGARDVPWLEAPPEAHAAGGAELLARLGALDARGASPPTGRAMLRFAVHPRAARVVVEGERRGVAEDACVAAAILAEGDIRAVERARRSARAARRTARPRRRDLGALLDLFREARGVPLLARARCARRASTPGATHAVARAS